MSKKIRYNNPYYLELLKALVARKTTNGVKNTIPIGDLLALSMELYKSEYLVKVMPVNGVTKSTSYSLEDETLNKLVCYIKDYFPIYGKCNRYNDFVATECCDLAEQFDGSKHFFDYAESLKNEVIKKVEERVNEILGRNTQPKDTTKPEKQSTLIHYPISRISFEAQRFNSKFNYQYTTSLIDFESAYDIYHKGGKAFALNLMKNNVFDDINAIEFLEKLSCFALTFDDINFCLDVTYFILQANTNHKATTDENRTLKHFEFSYIHRNRFFHYDDEYNFAKQAFDINSSQMIQAQITQASAYIELEDFEQAESILKNIEEKLPKMLPMGSIYDQLRPIYFNFIKGLYFFRYSQKYSKEPKYLSAIECFETAISEFDKYTPNNNTKNFCSYYLFECYTEINNQEKAVFHYQKAKSFFAKFPVTLTYYINTNKIREKLGINSRLDIPFLPEPKKIFYL